MKLIIDGYNLIKKVIKMHHISTNDRDQFLKRLGLYAKNKGLHVLIVLDGGDVGFNYHEKVYGIEVIYSGFQETADDVIIRYMQNYRSQEELMVISSDREIVDLATSRRIDILKSEEFYKLLQASESSNTRVSSNNLNNINKLSTSKNLELDELMEQASRNLVIKPDNISLARKPVIKKISKAESQKARKLKKL